MSVYESIIKGLNEAIYYEKGNVKAKKVPLPKKLKFKKIKNPKH